MADLTSKGYRWPDLTPEEKEAEFQLYKKRHKPKPVVGDTRGQWQCTRADPQEDYELYIWNRNKCGVTIHQYITKSVTRFSVNGNGDHYVLWETAEICAIKLNNDWVNLAKAYLREFDYCD